MYSRREFGKLAIAGLAMPTLARAAGAVDASIAGVRVGVQTYSFRALPRPAGGDAVDGIIAAMTACGLADCELFAPQVEPGVSTGQGRNGDPAARAKAREDLRRWRVDTPLDHFERIRAKFAAAGLSIYAYNYSFETGMSDTEIGRGFDMARALGAEIITASTTLKMAERVVPFAEGHQMVVAMHGHSNAADPNEFCTPDSFAAAMKMSKLFKVNLDIGHFTAANFDAVAYIREHHADITNLHLKDRKKNQGDNMAWGEGDTPIMAVLQLLKKEKWPIRAFIEYEHNGTASPVDEVKTCFAFVKRALA